MAHTYWRLSFSDGTYVAITKIEMRATVGGADQCSGGTATASTTFSTYTASKAFDADPATYWWSDATSGNWIQYQFAAPVDVVQLVVGWANENSNISAGVTTLTLQYSDDGTNWTNAYDPMACAAKNQTQTFTFGAPKSYWKFQFLEFVSTTYITIAEFQLRTSVGGSDVTTSTTPVYAPSVSSWEYWKAVDNSTSTGWSDNNNNGVREFLFFLGDTTDIVEYVIQPHASYYSQAPKAWMLYHSADGINWTEADYAGSQTGWSGSRTFNTPTSVLSRVTQASVEVLTDNDTSARVTQESVEVLTNNDTSARTSQISVEVLTEIQVDLRVDQAYVEVLSSGPADLRVDQAYVEVLASSTSSYTEEYSEAASTGDSVTGDIAYVDEYTEAVAPDFTAEATGYSDSVTEPVNLADAYDGASAFGADITEIFTLGESSSYYVHVFPTYSELFYADANFPNKYYNREYKEHKKIDLGFTLSVTSRRTAAYSEATSVADDKTAGVRISAAYLDTSSLVFSMTNTGVFSIPYDEVVEVLGAGVNINDGFTATYGEDISGDTEFGFIITESVGNTPDVSEALSPDFTLTTTTLTGSEAAFGSDIDPQFVILATGGGIVVDTSGEGVATFIHPPPTVRYLHPVPVRSFVVPEPEPQDRLDTDKDFVHPRN